MTSENNWSQHSLLVLKQLEVLTAGIKTLTDSLNEVKNDITAIKAKEDKVLELIEWKEKIVEVASPTQLKELKTDVVVLKTSMLERNNNLNSLDSWKKKIDEITSPTQLQKLSNDVEDLKIAKIKAYTIFAVIQALMGFAVFFDKVM